MRSIEPKRARQGRRGFRILLILIVSLLLAMIIWLAVELYGYFIAPDDQVGGDPANQPVESLPEQPAE